MHYTARKKTLSCENVMHVHRALAGHRYRLKIALEAAENKLDG